MLNRLNTPAVGGVGLLIGSGAIVSSVVAFFKLLSDPSYLDALFVAVMHARKHALEPTDLHTYAQLVGVSVAIIGAIVVALLMSYFGMPRNIASSANANDAAQASNSPRKE